MDLSTEFAVLASSAATTIVSLLATDSWAATKASVASLWRHHPRADEVAADLDAAHDKLVAVTAPEDAQLLQANLVVMWQSRLAALLAETPLAQAELRALIGRETSAEPVVHQWIEAHTTGGGDAYVAGRDQTITHHGPR